MIAHDIVKTAVTHLSKIIALKLHLPDFDIRGKPCLERRLLTCTEKNLKRTCTRNESATG